MTTVFISFFFFFLNCTTSLTVCLHLDTVYRDVCSSSISPCVLLTWCYFGFSAFCWWHTVSVQQCLFCLWINKPTDLAVFNNLRTWDSPQTTCAINTVTLLSWLRWFICSRGVQTICDRGREKERKNDHQFKKKKKTSMKHNAAKSMILLYCTG